MHTAVTFFQNILATPNDHIIFITEQGIEELLSNWSTDGYSKTKLENKFGSVAKLILNSQKVSISRQTLTVVLTEDISNTYVFGKH